MPIGYREGQYTRRKKYGSGHTLVTRKTLDAVANDDAIKVEVAQD